MDFDDLLVYTYILFRDFPEVLARYREQFRYVQWFLALEMRACTIPGLYVFSSSPISLMMERIRLLHPPNHK